MFRTIGFCWRLLADANRTTMTNTYYVYTVLRYSWWWTVDLSETCRVLYQTNLRNSASRWLSLYEYITMHGPLKVKFIFFLLSFFQTHFLVYPIIISLSCSFLPYFYPIPTIFRFLSLFRLPVLCTEPQYPQNPLRFFGTFWIFMSPPPVLL